MLWPSGAHCPARSPRLSVLGENVSCLGFLPLTSMSQRWLLPPSAAASSTRSSARVPSGESCGSFRERKCLIASFEGNDSDVSAAAAGSATLKHSVAVAAHEVPGEEQSLF